MAGQIGGQTPQPAVNEFERALRDRDFAGALGEPLDGDLSPVEIAAPPPEKTPLSSAEFSSLETRVMKLFSKIHDPTRKFGAEKAAYEWVLVPELSAKSQVAELARRVLASLTINGVIYRATTSNLVNLNNELTKEWEALCQKASDKTFTNTLLARSIKVREWGMRIKSYQSLFQRNGAHLEIQIPEVIDRLFNAGGYRSHPKFLKMRERGTGYPPWGHAGDDPHLKFDFLREEFSASYGVITRETQVTEVTRQWNFVGRLGSLKESATAQISHLEEFNLEPKEIDEIARNVLAHLDKLRRLKAELANLDKIRELRTELGKFEAARNEHAETREVVPKDSETNSLYFRLHCESLLKSIKIPVLKLLDRVFEAGGDRFQCELKNSATGSEITFKMKKKAIEKALEKSHGDAGVHSRPLCDGPDEKTAG